MFTASWGSDYPRNAKLQLKYLIYWESDPNAYRTREDYTVTTSSNGIWSSSTFEWEANLHGRWAQSLVVDDEYGNFLGTAFDTCDI